MMDVQTLTLTDFLLARIAEDERRWTNPAVIRLSGPWLSDLVLKMRAECEAKRRIVELHPTQSWREAKRVVDFVDGHGRYADVGLVEHCAGCEDYSEELDRGGSTTGEKGEWVYPCTTLRLLALPCADHPDYDEAWRP